MDLATLAGRQLLDHRDPLPVDRPFTAPMARAEGVSDTQLRWLTAKGYLAHPVKNVYWANQLPDSTALRCRALALVVPEDAVVTDRHAGWLLGTDMVLAPNEHLVAQPISVFRPSGKGRIRLDLAVSGERDIRPYDVIEVDGLRVTTPLRTAWDLGRHRYLDRAVCGIDAMLALGRFTQAELIEGVERFRGRRWVTTLRLAAPLGDGRSQSPGETVLRLRWIEAGLPTPISQLEVWSCGTLLGVLDIATEELRYAAEYDGEEWHTSPEQVAHDRERRDGLAGEDWLVDVFVAADLFGPTALPERRLRAGAAEARRRVGTHV